MSSLFSPLDSLHDNTVIVLCFLKDMNEPANFVHGTAGEKCLGDQTLENPPYMPRKFLSAHPGMWTLQHYGQHLLGLPPTKDFLVVV